MRRRPGIGPTWTSLRLQEHHRPSPGLVCDENSLLKTKHPKAHAPTPTPSPTLRDGRDAMVRGLVEYASRRCLLHIPRPRHPLLVYRRRLRNRHTSQRIQILADCCRPASAKALKDMYTKVVLTHGGFQTQQLHGTIGNARHASSRTEWLGCTGQQC